MARACPGWVPGLFSRARAEPGRRERGVENTHAQPPAATNGGAGRTTGPVLKSEQDDDLGDNRSISRDSTSAPSPGLAQRGMLDRPSLALALHLSALAWRDLGRAPTSGRSLCACCGDSAQRTAGRKSEKPPPCHARSEASRVPPDRTMLTCPWAVDGPPHPRLYHSETCTLSNHVELQLALHLLALLVGFHRCFVLGLELLCLLVVLCLVVQFAPLRPLHAPSKSARRGDPQREQWAAPRRRRSRVRRAAGQATRRRRPAARRREPGGTRLGDGRCGVTRRGTTDEELSDFRHLELWVLLPQHGTPSRQAIGRGRRS